jgi:hypothetical protein
MYHVTFGYLFCAHSAPVVAFVQPLGHIEKLELLLLVHVSVQLQTNSEMYGSGINFLEIPMELWLNKGGSLEEGIDDCILLLIEDDINLL